LHQVPLSASVMDPKNISLPEVLLQFLHQRLGGCLLQSGTLICDFIVWVSTPFTNQSEEILPPFGTPRLMKGIWVQIYNLVRSPEELSSYINSFWRTLIANVDKYKQPVDERFYIQFPYDWYESRVADEKAEKYIAQHPTRPNYEDYETKRRIKIEYDDPSISEEYSTALKDI
jgi:hypothetical protein